MELLGVAVDDDRPVGRPLDDLDVLLFRAAFDQIDRPANRGAQIVGHAMQFRPVDAEIEQALIVLSIRAISCWTTCNCRPAMAGWLGRWAAV